MFYLKTTVRKTKKKNIGCFLAVLFCTLVIVSSIGTSFGIRNSYAQAQQQQIQQAPTVAFNSPWSNNLQVSSASNSQPLCKAGICSQSSAPASTTQTTNADPTQIANVDPTNTHTTISQTATNSKPLTLSHQFTSSKIIGPDRFRYIGYYWTTPNTPRGVDVGTSSGVGIGFGGGTAQPPNVKQEVDTNEGQKTLAIQLQYQGVLPLAGVTAGLKLPAGFRASNPLTDDPTRWDIGLSEYKGVIQTGQGIVLYFYVNILPTAKVGLPVLGPVALHFLTADSRSINDQMEAIPENILQRAFSNVTNVGNPLSACTSVGTAGNCTTTSLAPFTHNLDFKRDYLGQFSRQIPFDFINQVIPVIFKVSGQETLDVVTLPYGAPVSLDAISTHILKIPNDDTSRIRLAVTNTGDAGVWDMTVNVFPGLQSSLGINGLTPSAISSPNIPQTLFSTILPIGIVGHSTFYLGYIPANGIKEFDVNVYPTHYVAGTVELLNVQLTYNNVVGTRVWTGTNTPSSTGGSAVCNGPNNNGGAPWAGGCGAPTLNQVYFAIAPSP
ncbi:MAG: hypothetical protein WA364_23065 [Candidatus Nitrosopolaris sp.]